MPVLWTAQVVIGRIRDHSQQMQAAFPDLTRPTKAIQEAAKDLLMTRSRHSEDFRSVHWFGADYQFTASQAACIEVLWQAWEAGTPELGQEFIVTEIDVQSERLVDLFKGHPAWGKMIVPGSTKGAYRLEELALTDN